MSSLYGAMLADGDYVLMGAGIPMVPPPPLWKSLEKERGGHEVLVSRLTDG